ncbi:PIN-like domain-containing protein [Microcoleus sp. T3_A4]|uniref:PIN-like domain-containing protein n=1 Tax=Microcoleus sp. T3_A4 TaxID=2818968 RepID=UPI002FD69E62
MKDLFPGYYSPSDEDFLELWQKCIFIFDTNVILDFYEHRNETHEDFFKVLDAINFKASCREELIQIRGISRDSAP